ncbi:MAG: CehA/McbA family metallohydrolase [Calditrichaeota bacterium]|nr:CehA/McbA family metallohydrolase [Calditrichota bacterium]
MLYSKSHRNMVLLILLTGLFAAWSPTYSHPDDEMEKIQIMLLKWANGFLNSDSAAVAPLLAKDFKFDWGEKKAAFLRRVALNSLGASNVIIRYAYQKHVGEKILVSPVVIYYDRGNSKTPWTLTFVKEDGEWKIASMTRAPALPPELKKAVLPEYTSLHEVSVTVRDADTGEPIATRVHIKDQAGEYWPPQGHMKNIPIGWRQDVGGDVMVAGKTFAYVEPDFILPVPEGSYTIEVKRGMEYEPATLQFKVTSSEIPEIKIKLKRWINLRKQGWYSGDTHVHFLGLRTAMQEARGEDLNVINILATKWGELITNVEQFTGAPSVLSDSNQIVYFNEETRHGFLGHTVLLNLKELIYPLSWGGPNEGVPDGYDYPAMAYQADKAHKQQGFVSWAHFPYPSGELAVDVALGKLDAVDLFTWGDPFNEKGPRPAAARIWYRILNCGFRIPVSAGTDKMLNTQVVGSVRTYVKFDGAFTYDNWIKGIRAGRTFVTTGPMLKFTANGKEIGDTINSKKGDMIKVRAEVRSQIPIERMEIIKNGEIVATKQNVDKSQNMTFQTEVTVDGSSWIAARVYSSKLLPYQAWDVLNLKGIPVLAHTSPIYINVDGRAQRSPEDAAYLAKWCDYAIEWARNKARYLHESQRQEIVELFTKAKAVYLQQVQE